QIPEEVLHFPSPIFAGEVASDHKPVIVDLRVGGADHSPLSPMYAGNHCMHEIDREEDGYVPLPHPGP
ncbi:MAG: hypothetical protein ACYTG7_20820, partial [Planctomycetota bacterium]